VVTADHGLQRDEEIEIGLPSGDTAPAEVVGRDPSTDLAVLRTSASGLVPPTWGAEPLRVGYLLLAVTRPGRGPKAGLALISRLGDGWRTPSGGKLERYVELSAELHPGFSGGLLVDSRCQGHGLLTAGLVRAAPIVIPSATIKRTVESILAHGSVRRGYLGVASLPVRLPAPLAKESGQTTALLLTAVEDESPASRAGLIVGDLLLALDEAAVGQMGDLFPLLEEERIGNLARARVARGGTLREILITIGVRGEQPEGRSRP